MIRSIFAAIIVTGLVLDSSQCLSSESPVEESIHHVLESGIAAYFDADFPRLVSVLHPDSSRLFRNKLSARFDELSRVYSFQQISAVSGLQAHPKDLPVSDPDFFVLACKQAKARHPDLVGDPAILDIRETVFCDYGRVDITLASSHHVQTQRTDFGFLRPFVIVLARDQSLWKILSCPLADSIANNWSHDLGRASQATR